MLGTKIVKKSENNTGRFIIFSVITNIYNKKTKVHGIVHSHRETRKAFSFFEN